MPPPPAWKFSRDLFSLFSQMTLLLLQQFHQRLEFLFSPRTGRLPGQFVLQHHRVVIGAEAILDFVEPINEASLFWLQHFHKKE